MNRIVCETPGFSEESIETINDLLEFTRCVRPNGKAYGTAGKCRKGVEEESGKKPFKSAVTQGRFNIPHKGHVKLIRQMLEQAPVAYVVMGKGEANVNKDFRAQMLRAMLRKEGIDLSKVQIVRGEKVSDITKGLSEKDGKENVVLVLGEDQEKFLNSMGKSQGIGTKKIPRSSDSASSSAIRKMIDDGDEESLIKEYDGNDYLIRLAKVARKVEKNEFSEFDFTRCQRPNGTYYGTRGKCKRGKEVAQKEKPDKRRKTLERSRESLYGPDGKIDITKVEKRAEEWRNKAGIEAFPGTIDWKHDRVHVLVHDFLGGPQKIGEWIGQGRGSPTPAEETLVNMVHRAAALKARGDDPRELLDDFQLERYFRTDIQLLTGRNQIKDKDLNLYYDDKGKPDVKKFIRKYREMEKDPSFDKLLESAHSLWTNAGDYVLS
jgi:cytidyltransferase-like protein